MDEVVDGSSLSSNVWRSENASPQTPTFHLLAPECNSPQAMDDEREQDELPIVANTKHLLLTPIRVLASPTVHRHAIQTILLSVISVILAIAAAIAYIILHRIYVPTHGFTRDIHLQFASTLRSNDVLIAHGSGSSTSPILTHDRTISNHPWGTASIAPAHFAAHQPYDISVSLRLPRTRANLDAGNFMLALELRSASTTNPANAIVTSQRPAILRYRSSFVEQVVRLAWLLPYASGVSDEAETLHISMLEGWTSGRGASAVPREVWLQVESVERMQLYWAKVEFTARLGGLRWLMYHYRTLSFLGFSTVFWMVEMSFALVIWLLFSTLLAGGKEADRKTIKTDADAGVSDAAIKTEPDEDTEPDLSDTSHTFPTYSRQPPLHYTSSRVKQEVPTTSVEAAHSPEAEADDEDEDADFVLDQPGFSHRDDSGLGTSMESSGGGISNRGIRRRGSAKRSE